MTRQLEMRATPFHSDRGAPATAVTRGGITVKIRRGVLALVVVMLWSFTLPHAAAQGGGDAAPTGPVPRMPDGTVDLNGAWVRGGSVQDLERQAIKLEPPEIPLLPWAKALMDSRKPEGDPHAWCLPMGVPRAAGGYPWRFVQNYTHKAPTHMFILHEGNIHSYRQIFMDGREHPEFLDPTWFGHSIGSWDDDTLVIDTVGYNDKFWFDRRGHPHTEQLHTIERWTRIDLGHMVNEVTIDDPGAYSTIWKATFAATLLPGGELMEYICQENNQYGVAGAYANPFVGQ